MKLQKKKEMGENIRYLSLLEAESLEFICYLSDLSDWGSHGPVVDVAMLEAYPHESST